MLSATCEADARWLGVGMRCFGRGQVTAQKYRNLVFLYFWVVTVCLVFVLGGVRKIRDGGLVLRTNSLVYRWVSKN